MKAEEKARTDRSKAPPAPDAAAQPSLYFYPVRLLSCKTIPGTPLSAKGIKLHRLKSPVYTHTDPFPCQVACKCHEILTISE